MSRRWWPWPCLPISRRAAASTAPFPAPPPPLYPLGTKRWDTCAGEALLRAWKGTLLNINGEPYPYRKGENVYNDLGILAFLDPALEPLLVAATKRCQTTLDITRDADGRPIDGPWPSLLRRLRHRLNA